MPFRRTALNAGFRLRFFTPGGADRATPSGDPRHEPDAAAGKKNGQNSRSLLCGSTLAAATWGSAGFERFARAAGSPLRDQIRVENAGRLATARRCRRGAADRAVDGAGGRRGWRGVRRTGLAGVGKAREEGGRRRTPAVCGAARRRTVVAGEGDCGRRVRRTDAQL